jgi:SAM-dependent methyltransferase
MSRLEKTYHAHHEEGGRLEFTFGGKERAALIAAWIGTGRHLLDLGCRDGALTVNILEGNSVVGADIDRDALRVGRMQSRLREAAQLDLTAPLPFRRGAFDAVFAGEVLEHQPFPGWLVEEISRVLIPGGLFVGFVPNAYRLKNRLRFLLGCPFDVDPTHLRFFSRYSLSILLENHFTNIEIRAVVGRFSAIHPDLFSNTLVWRCRKRNP